MRPVTATVREGRLELNVPADWPDGLEVSIQPIEIEQVEQSESASAEEVSARLAAMDRIVPFEWNADEQQSWDVNRQTRKEREKASFLDDARRLSQEWQ